MLLARIEAHMREELSNLPNYTCLETIARFHGQPWRKLELLDTVRLEVIYSDHKEWYGLPGGRNLSKDSPGQLIGTGMSGTGAFAITLGNILAGVATITSRGEETVGGRNALKYDFRLPRFVNKFEITLGGTSGVVGEEGSFWVDPRTLDFIRLESRAIEIPPNLPVEETGTGVHYARMRISERDVLVPQQAELHMVRTKGEETLNHTEFTHCRAFSAQSAVRFDPEPEDPGTAPALTSTSNDPDRAVPSLLRITVQLITPITPKDTVGAPIEGRVIGDVRQKARIVIPNGSAVKGRIRRLERDPANGSPAFLVALEFTDVEGSGGPLPFYADLVRVDGNPGIRPALSERVFVPCDAGEKCQSGDRTITLPGLPGVALLHVRGATVSVPSGLRMRWRTRERAGSE